MKKEEAWKKLGIFVDISCPWLRLIGEKLEDNQGNLLEYWRVEKADSVVVITKQSNNFLFPPLMYRPGIGKVTLDFPGGRVSEGKSPNEVVPHILKRELGVNLEDIISLIPINPLGWEINSSFSNQKLYGFFAELAESLVISPQKLGGIYNNSSTGIKQLLDDLTCLQCRALFLEWLNKANSPH